MQTKHGNFVHEQKKYQSEQNTEALSRKLIQGISKEWYLERSPEGVGKVRVGGGGVRGGGGGAG